MRISTAYRFSGFKASVSAAEAKLTAIQKTITDGKKLTSLGDDPIAVVQAIDTRRLRGALGQYRSNLDSAKGVLGFSEQALGEVGNLMQRANQIALQGGTATVSQEQRATLASEIDTIQKQLVDLGNSKGPSGENLFGGQVLDGKAFNLAGSTLTFNGDNRTMQSEVGPTETLVTNTPAQTLFTNAFDALETLKSGLQGGNASQIMDVSVAQIQAQAKQIDLARGGVGTRLRRVDELSAQTDRRTDELTSHLSSLEDVDITQAITDYKAAETAYQASLTVVAKGFQTSLMDYLK